VVPAGRGRTNHLQKTSLLYNEFIIYNTAQVPRPARGASIA
jgi:hypothetical protein